MKLQILPNNSKTVTDIKNLTGNTNDQHDKICPVILKQIRVAFNIVAAKHD
jgi:hypothetical protein